MYIKLKNKELLNYIPIACLMMYFLVILCVYIPNMGGGGLQLPQNILCWLVMLLVVFLAGCYVVFVKELKWNLSFVIFIMGSFLLSLPLLWGDSEVQRYAFLRFAGLWGGLLFYFALLQFSFTFKLKRYLIVTIALSAIIQAVIASIQVSFTSPDNIFEFIPGTRPYGIFQQVNVLASFVATGYACAVWLLFRSKNWYYCFLLLVLIAFFSVALDALQSRAGFYGAIIYTLFIFGSGFRPREKNLTPILFIVIALSIIITHVLKHSGNEFLQHFGNVDKEGSNTQRWLILKATLAMIKEHPLSGWGYGSYEFAAERTALHVFHHMFGSNRSVSHAHNEFLYEWAEGGLLAVAGMVALISGYFLLLRRSPRNRKAVWGLALPIAFHLMVEYPLYLSVPHWLLLLIICRIATPERFYTYHFNHKVSGCFISSIATIGAIFLLTGFQTGLVLTRFERQGMVDFTSASRLINPWIEWERWQFDQHTALLVKFNQTHNQKLLRDYAAWAMKYLEHRNDIRVYQNLVLINKYAPLPARTVWLKQQWHDYYSALEHFHNKN